MRSFNRAALWTAAFFLAALAAMAVLVARQRSALSGMLATLDWPLFLAALAALGLYFALLWDAWHRTVRSMGERPARRATFEVWFVSQLGKYVPGRVLTIIGRILLSQRRGMRGAIALAATYVELVLLVITNLAATAAMELLFARRLVHGALFLWLPVLAALTVPALHPRLMTWALNRALRLLRRDPVAIDLAFGRILALAAMYAAAWAVYGLSGMLLVKGMTGLSWSAAAAAMPAFVFSWLLGLISFVVPGGLGVREGALVVLLAPAVPVAAGLSLSLVSRVMWMACELAGAAVPAMGALRPFGSVLAKPSRSVLSTADGRTAVVGSWPARMALRLIGVPHMGLRIRAALIMEQAARCDPPPRRILDAGCGPGLYLAELARLFPGAGLTGIDLQQEKLDQADAVLSALGVPHTLLRADLTAARPGNVHDLIICSDVLEHIADDGAAIASLAAALGEGGRLLITVPAAGRFSSSVAVDFDHRREGYTLDRIAGLLADAGLRVLRHRQYFKPCGRLAWRANRALLRWPALAAASFPPLFALAWLDRLLPDDPGAGGLMLVAEKAVREEPRDR